MLLRKQNGVDETMEYNEWKIYYSQILLDFGYSRNKDKKSAKLLPVMLKKKKLVKNSELRKMISNKDVYVFGVGDSLQSNIKKTNNNIFISAGSATSQLMEKNMF